MGSWAVDLGTTNTGVARWDSAAERPRLLELTRVCRSPGGEDHLEAPRLVPSATEVLPEPGFWARLSSRPLLSRLTLWGRLAWIGREAATRSEGEPRPGFAPMFKPYLGLDALRVIARAGGRGFTARDVTRLFLRELLVEIKEATGERVRDLVITTPVDAYESYRAELRHIARGLGVRRVRFIDEPVAAAIGYDVGPRAVRRALVADFGGGTLDLAVVELTPRGVEQGTCHVVAKEGVAVGGDLVDRWLLEAFAERLGYHLPEELNEPRWTFWFAKMLDEARRVKEAVHFRTSDAFYLTPPEDMRRFEARLRGAVADYLDVTRDDVEAILEQRGLYRLIDERLDALMARAADSGVEVGDLDDVLLVGGSTLLPRIYAQFERRFGRDRVRGWKPFEAVAYGACAYAAGQFGQSDFIVHDYAILTHDPVTHEAEHNVVVPRGTRFPTAPDFWKRRLFPTCSRGEPERMFKLVICELGIARGDERFFAFDTAGHAHKIGGEGEVAAPLVVPLNESNPTLGKLDPPHEPGDQEPRLEIAFGVDADRYLVATVDDLRTGKRLMSGEPVIRLL